MSTHYMRKLSTVSTERVWWGDIELDTDVKYQTRFSDSRRSDERRIARGQWSHKAEYIFSCIGLSVGLGNVLRFPFLAYDNGGAAFLIVYLLIQMMVGKPMYFMELSLGQFSGKGPTKVWDVNPAAKGIGFSMCMLCLVVAIYYNVSIAYALHFLFASLESELPWMVCKDEWVENFNCVSKRLRKCTDDIEAMRTYGACTCTGNASIDTPLPFNCSTKVNNTLAATELHFYKTVLNRSESLDLEHFGTPNATLTFYLALSWIIISVCIIKGIKSSGKAVYFTASFPYFIIIALLVRGFFLDGAIDGLRYFLAPQWGKLLDIKVWVAAANQVFFSLGVSFGGMISFGSYNRFDNKVYQDALIIASLDLVTSIVGGLVIFMTFGEMAKATGSTVDKVSSSEYGLAFVVYPKALSNMLPTQIWSVLFFFMLFTLGVDTEFALIGTVITSIQDEYPELRSFKCLITIFLGTSCFLLGLPLICPAGDYAVLIVREYVADFCLLIVGGLECISISWVYGVGNFMKDLEYMMGKRPHLAGYWALCWTVFCPLIILTIFINRIFYYSPPTYPTGKPFPVFAQVVSWLLCTAALSPIPIWFICLLKQSYLEPEITTTKERLDYLFRPTDRWRPNDGRYLQQKRTSMLTS